MTLGARVTISITLLVAVVLGLSTAVAVYVRGEALQRDVDRQASDVAQALRAGIEPLSPAAADERLKDVVWRSKQHGHSFQIEILKVAGYRVSSTGWSPLIERAEAEDQPAGKLWTEEDGWLGRLWPRPVVYAMAVPLLDAEGMSLPGRDPRRKPVAFLGLRRDVSYIRDEVMATVNQTLPLVLGVLVFLALGVHLALRTNVMQPVRRLLDGIDAVGKGDLSRVILAERDDEIGTLASRFNAMTGSLREAREETTRGTEARLALETRLRHSEKLATIGQMAAEIAHEVGTPLNVIGGRARALSRKGGDPAEVAKNAGIIAGQADRIAKIIRQVLDFSRKSGPTNTEVDLAAVVREAVAFLSETIRRQRIQTEIKTRSDLAPVPGDPEQIQQVCLNLLMNAVHAMPSGGVLSVVTDRVVRRKEGLDLAPPAAYALLQIADSGAGVPAADREKIFEPFFTTKDAGQGTGLGLAVSKGIVKDHDGWIEVDARPEGGALFSVFLPVAPTPSSRDAWEEATPSKQPAG